MSTISPSGCIRLYADDGSAWDVEVPATSRETKTAICTAIRPGVFNGERLTAEVLAVGGESILGKYLLLGHQDEDVSAMWPEYALGQVTAYRFDGEKLDCRVALFPERCSAEMLAKLDSGERLGVSIGFSGIYQDGEGEEGGRPYITTVEKLYITHLAVVPMGACSIEDGCELHLEGFAKRAESKKMARKRSTFEGEDLPPVVPDGAPIEASPTISFKSVDEMRAFVDAIKGMDESVQEAQLIQVLDWAFSEIGGFFDSGVSGGVEGILGVIDWISSVWDAGDGPFGSESEGSGEEEGELGKRARVARYAPGKPGKVKAQPRRVKFRYPVMGADGKVSWKETEDDSTAKDAIKAFGDGVQELFQANSVARDLLMERLELRIPKMTDDSKQTYRAFPIGTLQQIVSDLETASPDGLLSEAFEQASVPEAVALAGGFAKVAPIVPKPAGGKQKVDYLSTRAAYLKRLNLKE